MAHLLICQSSVWKKASGAAAKALVSDALSTFKNSKTVINGLAQYEIDSAGNVFFIYNGTYRTYHCNINTASGSCSATSASTSAYYPYFSQTYIPTTNGLMVVWSNAAVGGANGSFIRPWSS